MLLVSAVLTILGGLGSVYYVEFLGRWVEEERVGKKEVSLSVLVGLCFHFIVVAIGLGLQAAGSVRPESVLWIYHGGVMLSLCASAGVVIWLRLRGKWS
ncbi:hypothetical protein [Laceyella putida]|uniref:Uncharacterized protein n=1 Tax=Laceyella putida TaxID=110101 RepID=A0ABW2RNK1_9BACL